MNNKSRNVSSSVIKRLPRYHRFLGDLRSKGLDRISSKELSNLMGLTASQIRQDLNCFGEFGQQGYGYNIELLQQEIGKILGLTKLKKAILIGAGHMGKALAMHFDMTTKGFNLIGIFDKKPSLSGQTVRIFPSTAWIGLMSSAVKTSPIWRYSAFREARLTTLPRPL